MPRDTLGHVFLRVRAFTNARSLRLGLCNGKPHTASRMNIADIMLLYFITRVHRMRYATLRSRVSCISPCRPCTRPYIHTYIHTYPAARSDTLACDPPPPLRSVYPPLCGPVSASARTIQEYHLTRFLVIQPSLETRCNQRITLAAPALPPSQPLFNSTTPRGVGCNHHRPPFSLFEHFQQPL